MSFRQLCGFFRWGGEEVLEGVLPHVLRPQNWIFITPFIFVLNHTLLGLMVYWMEFDKTRSCLWNRDRNYKKHSAESIFVCLKLGLVQLFSVISLPNLACLHLHFLCSCQFSGIEGESEASNSSGSSGLVGEGPRNMKSIQLYSVAIFLWLTFTGGSPPCPHRIRYWAINNRRSLRCPGREENLLLNYF